jgi:hypothetical protein
MKLNNIYLYFMYDIFAICFTYKKLVQIYCINNNKKMNLIALLGLHD